MQTQIARFMALGGGAFGIVVALTILTNSNFDAWPFLVFILLLACAAPVTAVWRGIKPQQRSLLWLANGTALLYCGYISRFSIGLYLFPAVALILLAGLLTIRDYASLIGRPTRADNPPAETSLTTLKPVPALVPQLPKLTLREREVLSLIAEGKSNQEIADALVISPNTVRHHVHQLLHKLQCTSRSEAATMVRAAGWFTTAPDDKP